MIRRRFVQLALLLSALICGTDIVAQPHIVGIVGGGSFRLVTLRDAYRTSFLPDLGVSSTIEMNRVLSFGAEARFLQNAANGLRLTYLETPYFVRIAVPLRSQGPRAFARLGLAPAIELRCTSTSSGPETSSGPDTRRVIADPVGFSFHLPRRQPDLSRQIACLQRRQTKLDVGWLAALGTTFRIDARHQFSVEARATTSLSNLVSNEYAAPLRNRSLSLLLSTGTRRF